MLHLETYLFSPCDVQTTMKTFGCNVLRPFFWLVCFNTRSMFHVNNTRWVFLVSRNGIEHVFHEVRLPGDRVNRLGTALYRSTSLQVSKVSSIWSTEQRRQGNTQFKLKKNLSQTTAGTISTLVEEHRTCLFRFAPGAISVQGHLADAGGPVCVCVSC